VSVVPDIIIIYALISARLEVTICDLKFLSDGAAGTLKRQSPMSLARGDGAFYVFYVGPSCSTPPRSQKGLPAKKCEATIRKGLGKSKLKKNTGDRSQ